MNQILNICRKDARQLWLEIAVSFAILLCFVYAEPQAWPSGGVALFSMASAAGVAVALLYISWGIIIIRLVQAERLVGGNQFWTTRPYEWPKLMAAKGLFVLLFLYAPLMLAQLFLLVRAQLPVVQHVPLLLLNLVMLTAGVVLPLTCFAAITGSFAQATLAMLGGLIFAAGTAFLDLPGFRNVPPLFLTALQFAIAGGILLAVLLQQYSRRATRRSLAIFALAPVLLLIAQVTLRGSSLAAVGYPRASGPLPLSIEFDSDPERVSRKPVSADPKAMIFVRVPLLVSRIPPGISFSLHGRRLTLTSANGYTWHSPWLVGGGTMLAPDPVAAKSRTASDFPISRAAYDHLGQGSVAMRVEFTLAQLEDQLPVQSTVSTFGERVPGLGSCELDEGYFAISCLSAFREPSYFAVSTFRKAGPSCEATTADLYPAHGLVGSPDNPSTSLTISPVVVSRLQLMGASGRVTTTLCPGLPMTFVKKLLKQRLLVQLPAATVLLKDYAESYKVVAVGRR